MQDQAQITSQLEVYAAGGGTEMLSNNVYREMRYAFSVLVIDQANGPADVLMSTLGVLLDQEVAVTVVTDHAEALGALEAGGYDLVVVGTTAERLDELAAIVPRIRARQPDLPIMVVGLSLDQSFRWHAHQYGVDDVVNMPGRAAELRALAHRVAQHYLM